MVVSQQDLDHILNHTGSIWDHFNDRNLFITGGTGFFGKWILESLVHATKKMNIRTKVFVLSRNPTLFLKKYPHYSELPFIEFVKGDIVNFEFFSKQIDYVIHAATDADAKLNVEYPLTMLDTIVNGTRRVLDYAVFCNARRVLLTSSGAVYGRLPADISHVEESYSGGPDPLQPASVYAEAKRMAELLCAIYQSQHNLKTVIARCFAFVGPYLNLDIHFAIGNFIRDGLNHQRIKVNGDGTPLRSYLYAADLAIWLLVILLEGKPGQAYNVGSDQSIAISDLAQMVDTCFLPSPGVSITRIPRPDVSPERYVPDVYQAKNELNLECWIGLEEAIKRTIDFHNKKSH
jgi:nucleoside-diphosphate-sugar epimerase